MVSFFAAVEVVGKVDDADLDGTTTGPAGLILEADHLLLGLNCPRVLG